MFPCGSRASLDRYKRLCFATVAIRGWRWMFITGVFPSVLFFAMLLSSCKPRPMRSCALPALNCLVNK